MKRLVTIAPLSPGVPAMLRGSLGAVQCLVLDLAKMDLRFEGSLDGGGKCVWLTDGRRCEFEISPDGGWLAATSKAPDPAWPGNA
jgi:hypothetical protein